MTSPEEEGKTFVSLSLFLMVTVLCPTYTLNVFSSR